MPLQSNYTLVRPGFAVSDYESMQLVVGSGESSINDLIRPNGARPLAPGEWVELTGNGGRTVRRGGNNVVSSAGVPDGEGTAPAYMFAAQATGHPQVQSAYGLIPVYAGPYPQILRTTLCCTTDLVVGDEVSVWDYDGGDAPYGVVRRVLAKADGGFVVGRVKAILGTDSIEIEMIRK